MKNQIDNTRLNDPEYLIGFGVSLNFPAVQKAAISAYKLNSNLVATPEMLTAALYDRYKNNLPIKAAFNVPVSSEMNEGGKAFEDTFVGSIIALLFPPDSPDYSPPPPPVVTESESWSVGKIAGVATIVVAAILIIGTALYFFTQPRKAKA